MAIIVKSVEWEMEHPHNFNHLSFGGETSKDPRDRVTARLTRESRAWAKLIQAKLRHVNRMADMKFSILRALNRVES